MADLDEAIVLGREAFELCPQGHPDHSTSLNNLANSLSTRYNQLGAMADLDEAIVLSRDAVDLRLPSQINLSSSLKHLACALYTRFMQLRQPDDEKSLFSLYAQLVSSTDLSAARAWIQIVKGVGQSGHCVRGNWEGAGYFVAVIGLMGHRSLFVVLFRRSEVSVGFPKPFCGIDVCECGSYAGGIGEQGFDSAGFPSKAVSELVTRAPIVGTFEEEVSHRLSTSLPPLPQHLIILKKHSASLAVDAFSACLRRGARVHAVELLEQGRSVFWSQLSRLRFPLDDVMASGPAGRLLADEFMHVASLIHSVLDSPGADQHGWLCHLNLEMQRIIINIRELPGLSRFFPRSSQSYNARPITQESARDLSETLHALTEHAKKVDVRRELGSLMRNLWDQVVSPIVDFLLTTLPLQSRIWWCPTAEFSVLPLHVAGPYRKGQQNLSGLYISSYTPTLNALIRARRPAPSNTAGGGKHFIAIGQGNAIGQVELLSIRTELANIGQHIGGLASFTQIEGPESCISRVAEELCKTEWVHLACHGLPNRTRPFESAFALHDGHFTIERIMRYEESPDEVIHLTSAMQFAGFRSVIGTMWVVDDGETNKVTSTFYKHMVDESGCLDHTRAAFALNKTMKSDYDHVHSYTPL
ncbi:CHAT domain-containing protein [Boletus edulis]|nr:CHAT domain-containing protein [Boletus edulis]